jgi:hypothetical protein
MLLTVPKYSKLKGVPYQTIVGYLKRGLLSCEYVAGIRVIDSEIPVPVVKQGSWPKGKPRKKKSDLALLAGNTEQPPPADLLP